MGLFLATIEKTREQSTFLDETLAPLSAGDPQGLVDPGRSRGLNRKLLNWKLLNRKLPWWGWGKRGRRLIVRVVVLGVPPPLRPRNPVKAVVVKTLEVRPGEGQLALQGEAGQQEDSQDQGQPLGLQKCITSFAILLIGCGISSIWFL